jgi:hypothetical protein
MPKQLTDEEFNFLQARRQVADFVESIYNDPQLNREAKSLIKKKYPNLQIPDYDIENRVEARLNTEKQEREAAEERRRRADEDAKFAKMRKDTQTKHGFTDDAMTRLEQLMIDRNIGDYEAGAMLMASKEPKPSDATYDSGFWHVDKSPGFTEIAKDPEAWGRNEILKAIRTDQDNARNR